MNIKSGLEKTLIIILGIPILFGKINLIDNHEIIRFTQLYSNYFDYFLNHSEIIPRLQEANYRPIFYIIKGFFFFLFKTNSFLHFLVQYLIFIIVFINFINLCKLFSKKRFEIFLISSIVLINGYSIDFIYRLGPQETLGLFFISFILYWFCKYYCKPNKPSNKKIILISILIFLFSAIKLPFAIISFFISIIFLIQEYQKNKKINLIFLLSVFIQFFICLLLILNYIKNGHTYSGNEFKVFKTFYLFVIFPLKTKLNLYFLLLQLILIVFLKIQNIKINYKFLFFINFFYLLNYFLYQGWNVARYAMIYILIIFFLNFYFFLQIENKKKKFIFIFKTYLVILVFLNCIFHYSKAYKTLKFNFIFDNAFQKISLSNNIAIDNYILEINPESYKSILIFVKNKNKNIKIYNYQNNSLNEIIVTNKFLEKMNDNELIYKNIIMNLKIDYCVKFIDEKKNNKINCPPNTKEIKIL